LEHPPVSSLLRRRAFGVIAATALIATLHTFDAPAANAQATCTRDASTRTLFVTITDPGTALNIRAGGGAIDVSTYSGIVIPCPGPPTTSNTDTIIIKDESGGDTLLMTILRPHRFAPGFTDEGDGTSEIEFQVDLGAGTDLFNVEAGEFGTGTGVRFGLGTAGINLNGDSDVDLTLVGAERVSASGTDAQDIISAGGAFATGEPFPIPIRSSGFAENDILAGGRARDVLTGQQGNDRIVGGAGDDDLDGAGGLDLLIGFRGDDVLNGGDDRDDLRGSDGGDELIGARGNDDLRGQEGQDELRGNEGNDRLDGGPDRDDCDGGPGANRFLRCERIG
jgi:Ca2+-binding RTX toxin-like protein